MSNLQKKPVITGMYEREIKRYKIAEVHFDMKYSRNLDPIYLYS